MISSFGTQGGHISKLMAELTEYSKSIASKTIGLKRKTLYSNTDYKEWRKAERAFKGEMKKRLGQIGKPSYMKGIQAKNIGHLFNINKRQIYLSKDFAKAAGGIGMTPLYRQAMSFSKKVKVGQGKITSVQKTSWRIFSA